MTVKRFSVDVLGTRLPVHRVALTSVNTTEDGEPCLVPALAVWADLAALRAADIYLGPDDSGALSLLAATALAPTTDPALVDLTLVDLTTAGLTTAGLGQSPAVPMFVLRLPAVFVAMTSVVSVVRDIRIVLLDGAAPVTPETTWVEVTDLAAAVAVHPDLSAAALETRMAPEWTHPARQPVEEDPDAAEDPKEPMRDLLWIAVAGTASGQVAGWNRLVALARWATARHSDATTASPEIPDLDLPEGPEHLAALLDACERLALNCHPGLVPVQSDGSILTTPAMAPLRDQIISTVLPEAVAALVEGAEFDAVAEDFGLTDAICALGVLAANRAVTAVTDGSLGAGRYQPAYVAGVWLDADLDEPWWTVQACQGLLLHHDTSLLGQVLGSRGTAPSGEVAVTETTRRFMHVLADALVGFDLSPDGIGQALADLDVHPVNQADLVHVARTLLDAAVQAAEAGEPCLGCVAAEHMFTTTVDQDRLARAAAGLIAALTDLSADLAGFPVGDDTWVEHRDGWLDHWLWHASAEDVD